MDINEKAEAYDATLKAARQWIKDGCTDKEKICLESCIAELRESEDERIRKEIRNFLIDMECKKEWITYLERQKEKARIITANLLEDGITGVRKELIEFLANNIDASWVDIIKSADAYAQRNKSMFEKQKEQQQIPIMSGDADLYFDEWNQQQQNPTKRQCFEEGMRYAERLQKKQKPAEWYEAVTGRAYSSSDVEIVKEQPEVVLEKELENFARQYPMEDSGSYRNLMTLARHFYELGLNAKKKEE